MKNVIGWRSCAGTLAMEQVLSHPIKEIIGREADALGIAKTEGCCNLRRDCDDREGKGRTLR